jgi:hypothetical protein
MHLLALLFYLLLYSPFAIYDLIARKIARDWPVIPSRGDGEGPPSAEKPRKMPAIPRLRWKRWLLVCVIIELLESSPSARLRMTN